MANGNVGSGNNSGSGLITELKVLFDKLVENKDDWDSNYPSKLISDKLPEIVKLLVSILSESGKKVSDISDTVKTNSDDVNKLIEEIQTKHKKDVSDLNDKIKKLTDQNAELLTFKSDTESKLKDIMDILDAL